MNRLATEKSPYLLQHADNPVDWYPWGEEAFEKAKKEDKPVFLSIGYATCHWCHVMAHESFEDEDVARLMNEAFVNIKVDREERPDIDNTYMTVCQMLTGQGGWPLTIIMTPDKKPFFAATYLPKDSRTGMMGMTDLVPQIEQVWNQDRKRVDNSVQKIQEGFSKTLTLGQSDSAPKDDIPEKTFQNLRRRYDEKHGGFGESPKFPSPHNLLFLADYARIHDHGNAAGMTENTLLEMRLGGLWDHVGKGFHRYSTDREWLLPHFEKMLYDQAMLMIAYAEGWNLTGRELFRETALDIAGYVEECLTSPDGLFYSAEDADSEGEEGKFYVWSKDEIESVLSEDDARHFCDLFNIRPGGNFYDESTREKTGTNIPHLSRPVPPEMSNRTDNILKRLHEVREDRVRPLLDDKILTDWNGLMIAALARAGVLLKNKALTDKAEAVWVNLRKTCRQESGLLHMIKDGEAAIDGMADDYTFIIWGLTELYNATFKPDYLHEALELQKLFTEKFADPVYGGYFFTPLDSEHIMGRQKEIYDGAIPSSNSVAILNGYRLSRLTGDPSWEEKSDEILRAFSEQINDTPAGYTFAVAGHQQIRHTSNEIVICSDAYNPKTEEAISLCRSMAPVGSVIIVKTPETSGLLDSTSPFTSSYPADRELAVYVCSGFSCKAPVYSIKQLKGLFKN